MTTGDMAKSLQQFKELVSEFRVALQTFHQSGSQFRVLKTVNPHDRFPQDLRPPIATESPRNLIILDASYNPPTIAHRTLALSALAAADTRQHLTPSRLLLLFSTLNADKAASPAAFEQRLTMMTMLAHDMVDELTADPTRSHQVVPIDIGVTTAPYYTDKAAAIDRDGQTWYPQRPRQTHLIGYDTLVRFFAAKYYQKFNPPFAALAPYFDAGHCLRATLRPTDDTTGGGSADEQAAFLDRLRSGEMDKDGARREWAEQVELVPPNPQGGVSSTRIRKAVQSEAWDEVKQLCTPRVAEWLQSEALY